MFFIDTSRNGKPIYDPIVNQSLDNYLINDLRLKGHGLIMYINSPCVIIGANQNAYAEVNLNYLKKNNITLVRRTGGGGAVYHDFGNIIFENIVVNEETHFGDFKYYAAPIVNALRDLGLQNVEMKGKNDISIQGHKISGMSMVAAKNSIAAGGTLLYDLNHERAARVLTPNQDKLKVKGIESVDKRILNIRDLLPEKLRNLSTDEFKNLLLKKIFNVDSFEQIPKYTLTAKDWKIIDSRVKEKYATKEWNYGRNPEYEYYVSKYFKDVGTIAFNFNVKDNVLTDFKTYGDVNYTDLSSIDTSLKGTVLNKDALADAFTQGNYRKVFNDILLKDLVDMILNRKNSEIVLQKPSK